MLNCARATAAETTIKAAAYFILTVFVFEDSRSNECGFWFWLLESCWGTSVVMIENDSGLRVENEWKKD